MTKISRGIPAGFTTTDASFRAWGSAISTLLDDVGLAKTADTGQINWTTVARPTATNTVAGYEIRVHDSTLGDTYFKIEYRTAGSTTGANASLQVTIGTGSDGAGTITGVMFAAFLDLMESSSVTTARNDTANATAYAYLDDGTVAWCLAPAKAVTYYSDLMIFARTSGADGAYNGDGAMVVNQYGANMPTGFRYYSYELGVAKTVDTSMASPGNLTYPYYATQASLESSSAAAFHVIEHLTPTLNFHKNVVILNAADAALGAEVTASVLGASHTYLSFGSTYKGLDGDVMSGTSTRGALALLWD